MLFQTCCIDLCSVSLQLKQSQFSWEKWKSWLTLRCPVPPTPTLGVGWKDLGEIDCGNKPKPIYLILELFSLLAKGKHTTFLCAPLCGVKPLLIKALYKCKTFVTVSLTVGSSASSATVCTVILKAFQHVIYLGAVRFISEFVSGWHFSYCLREQDAKSPPECWENSLSHSNRVPVS